MALEDAECSSASPSDVTSAKSLSLSDPHLPVNMAPGSQPVNFYGKIYSLMSDTGDYYLQ